MSIMTANTNTEIFSGVPELETALQNFKQKQVINCLKSVGEIFAQHKAWKDFGLSLVHRHFEMSAGEILVEAFNISATLSVMTPWNTKGNLGFPENPVLLSEYQVTQKKYIVPRNWCFTSSGEAVPFEFVATDDAKSIPELVPKFAQNVFCILKELGVETLVGIRRITEKSSWEITPPDIRANVSVYSEELPVNLNSKGMVRVGWQFDREGNVRSGGAFCSGCDVWCDCAWY